jgi:hypothetical protein
MLVPLLSALVVVLAILIIITIFRLHHYNEKHHEVMTDRVKMSDAYDEMKTGDLIFFVSAVHHPSNSIFTQAYFSHAGVVVRDGDLLYLSESHPGSAPHRSHRYGADFTPLLTRVRRYVGLCYWLKLSRPLDPGRDAAVRLAAFRTADAPHPYPTMARAALSLLGWPNRARHCFQHVAHVLDAARLVRGDEQWSDYGIVRVCREICGIHRSPLADGYQYSSPVQLLYDVPQKSEDATTQETVATSPAAVQATLPAAIQETVATSPTAAILSPKFGMVV